MRKITKEEAMGMITRRENATVLRSALEKLKVGEIMFVEQDECGDKQGPVRICKRIAKSALKQVYNVQTVMAIPGGWIVERLS